MPLPNLALPVLVTGATGFIGRHLVARLLAQGAAVRALVVPEEVPTARWTGPVEVVAGAITDRAAVARAVAGAGTVFHLAAVVGDWGAEAWFQRVTVGGTWNLLQAPGAATARLVLASSIVVYGDQIPRRVCDEDQPFGRALGAYSRAKQAQERLAWQVARERRLALSVVRPANVFGPGSRPWVIALAAQLRQGLPALIDGGDFNAGLCYVENLVDLLLLAATHPAAVGRVYNGCDEAPITWRQYVIDLARLAQTAPPRSLPGGLAYGAAAVCEGAWRLLRLPGRPPVTHESRNLVGAHHRIPITRARTELGFTPRVTYAEAMAAVGASLQQSSHG